MIFLLKLSIERDQILEEDTSSVPENLTFSEPKKKPFIPEPLDVVSYSQENLKLLDREDPLTLREWEAVFRSPFLRYRHVFGNLGYSQKDHQEFKQTWRIEH